MSDNEEEKEEEGKAKQEAAENAALDAVGNIAGPEAKAVTETAKVVKKNWPYIIGFNVLLFAIIFGPLIAILFAACSGGSSIYSLMSGGNFSSDGSANGNATSGNLGYPTGVNPEVLKNCLDKLIQEISPGSPLKGEWFATAGQKNNINPAFLIAIANKETSLANNGTDYTKPHPVYGGAYNIGNITDTNGHYKNYNSYEDGINGLGQYLAQGYLYHPTDPQTTVRKIAYIYCPPEPDMHGITCDTEGWIKSVESVIAKAQAKCPELQSNNSSNNGVPCIKEDAQGDCGYASACMMIAHYANKTFTTSSLFKAYPDYKWFNGMTKESNRTFKERNYQNGFDEINNALANNQPVIISGQFPNDNGAGGYNGGYKHYMVITGYDAKEKKYIVNNPMPGGCEAGIRLSEDYFRKNTNPDNPGWYAY